MNIVYEYCLLNNILVVNTIEYKKFGLHLYKANGNFFIVICMKVGNNVRTYEIKENEVLKYDNDEQKFDINEKFLIILINKIKYIKDRERKITL